MSKLTHDILVSRSTRWMKNTIGCRAVLSEIVAYTTFGEVPDVIGWTRGISILVECKTSRGDFLNDRNKRFRMYKDYGMGNIRFYVTLPGVVNKNDKIGMWGVYELINNRIVHKLGTKYSNCMKPLFSTHHKSEIALLVSAYSRMDRKIKE